MNETAIAAPLGRKDIRKKAQAIRLIAERFGCIPDGTWFDIIRFVEHVLPQIDSKFTLEIVSLGEMRDLHGETLPEECTIKIREDVYLRACNGEGRDRLTIAHEVGHYLLHGDRTVRLTRVQPGRRVKTFCAPEWQANAFAGEWLVDYFK